MKQVMKRLTALAVVMAACGGCSADYPSLYIQQNQVPSTGCIVPASGIDGISIGHLDVSPLPGNIANPGYVFTPLLINALSAGSATQRIMFLSGAEVEIRPAGAGRATDLVNTLAALNQAKRTALLSGSIQAGGMLGTAFYVIDAEQNATMFSFLADGESVNLVAHISVKASVDGSDITGSPFDYPMIVCRGCLLQDVGTCASLPEGFSGSVGGICNPLQDGVLQCCDNFAVCPAIGPTSGAGSN